MAQESPWSEALLKSKLPHLITPLPGPNAKRVIDLDNRECREMLEGFIAEHPEIWNEDIGEE